MADPSNSLAKAFDIFNSVRVRSPALERIWREGFGEQYAQEARPDAFYPQAVLDQIATAIESNQSLERDTILDVGCGHGLTALYLARRLNFKRIFGIDISAASIDLARDNHAKQAVNGIPNARFWVADAASTNLANDSCDAVTCLDVMLYFSDKSAAIKEIYRALRSRGLFAFTTWEQEGHSERLGADQVDDYRPLLQDAGFSIDFYDAVSDARDLQRRVLAGLIENEETLRSEIGDEAANMLVNMAKSASAESSGRRYVLGIVRKVDK